MQGIKSGRGGGGGAWLLFCLLLAASSLSAVSSQQLNAEEAVPREVAEELLAEG